MALPANIAKYYDGRRLLLNEAAATRTEYAMLDLARGQVEPNYFPGTDPAVVKKGGDLYAPLRAADYFRAAGDFGVAYVLAHEYAQAFGSLSASLAEVREEPRNFREIADATLADADQLQLWPATEPASVDNCLEAAGTLEKPIYFELPAAGVLLGSRSGEATEVKVSRFAKNGGAYRIGWLEPGEWATFEAPEDAAPERWRVFVFGRAEVCR